MLWGCSRVEHASELVGIRSRIHAVIEQIDVEITQQEAAVSGGGAGAERARENLRQLRRVRGELQQALAQGENWESLSDDARGRLGERMIQNLSVLPGINRTTFGPLTGGLINDISHVARLMARGQGGVQIERECRRMTPDDRRAMGCE